MSLAKVFCCTLLLRVFFARLASLALAHCLAKTEGNTFIITLALQIYSVTRAKSKPLRGKCTYSADIVVERAACKILSKAKSDKGITGNAYAITFSNRCRPGKSMDFGQFKTNNGGFHWITSHSSSALSWLSSSTT